LAKQIHNRIKVLSGFDIGTKSTIGTLCGLAMRNIQQPRILDWFSKPKNIMVQFFGGFEREIQHCHKQLPIQFFQNF
jgi:hypothetical protein